MAAAFHRRAFAEDLIERTNLGKVHVARGAPGRSVGTDIIRPEVVAQQPVGPRGKVLQREEVGELALFIRAGVLAQFDKRRLLARQRVSDPVGFETEIVGRLGLEADLLEGRDALVAAR